MENKIIECTGYCFSMKNRKKGGCKRNVNLGKFKGTINYYIVVSTLFINIIAHLVHNSRANYVLRTSYTVLHW